MEQDKKCNKKNKGIHRGMLQEPKRDRGRMGGFSRYAFLFKTQSVRYPSLYGWKLCTYP